MDEMKIKSKIFTGILSKVISKNLKSKMGVDCNVTIDEILLKNDGNKTSVKISIEGCVETSKISEIVSKFL